MRVLFVPSARKGDGIGHLRRCLELANEIPSGAVLFEPDEDESTERIRAVAQAMGLELPEDRFVFELRRSDQWELIVLDRRATSAAEFRRFAACATTVGIDEGGEAREIMPYLIDTLPLPAGKCKANIFSPAFHALPSRRRSPDDPPTGRVLITFGGEDPGSLSAMMAQTLIEEGHVSAAQISVAVGPLFRKQTFPHGVNVLHAPANLREILCDFDIVFTSFGLTAYEAVNAGVAVVLFNPTGYHRTLSRIAGFPEIGISSVNRPALRMLLSDRDTLRSTCAEIATTTGKSISEHLASLDFGGSCACPVCGERANPSVGRFIERSYFQCSGCSMVYQLDFSRRQASYDRAYFFEDYKRQYGRTYLEDFDNIRGLARIRLRRIRELGFAPQGKRILDVGCAFGPFLAEGAHQGAEVFGVDVSGEAVAYVRTALGLPCAVTSLEELDLQRLFGINAVDIVSMWYVVEHLTRLHEVLRKVNSLLPTGGMFAFSTPNLAGVSGRSDLEQFLANSPNDHATLWSPKIARAVLSRYGFQVREVSVTGHHPERFRIAGTRNGWKYRLLRRYSELARLGDTFECYAVKVSERSS